MPVKGEDWATIGAAIAAGKIDAKNHDVWLNALAADRVGTKRVLAAMTPLPTNLRRGTSGPRNVITDHGATGQPVTAPGTGRGQAVTYDQINDRINADPAMQRLAWDLGIRDGIDKPPERYAVVPNQAPGTYSLVDNGDGTGDWAENKWPELQWPEHIRPEFQ